MVVFVVIKVVDTVNRRSTSVNSHPLGKHVRFHCCITWNCVVGYKGVDLTGLLGGEGIKEDWRSGGLQHGPGAEPR